jgi:dihydrofolate synthase/folylpolyglutamate synthase
MNNEDTAYQATLEYLYGFVDYSLTRHLRYSPEKFNLERMREFMAVLGNPHLKYPTIHVAGTKGKGSICAMIANVFKVSGFKVGLYTSPHLQEYTERIKINDLEISKPVFVKLVEEIKPAIKQIKNLSTFEITTALAFLYFFHNKVDCAVIEVGLGGRLDATNVITPIISIISTISKDHVKILGNTFEKIGIEKAGIIKENVPVVISQQKPRIKRLFKEISRARNSEFHYVQDEIIYKFIQQDLKGQDFIILDKNDNQFFFHLPLLGFHQITNAMTTFLALKLVSQKGFQISNQKVEEGFRSVKWPGRFEVLSQKPLLIIDSAHNTDSIRKLLKTVKSVLPDKKIILIFGASEDKDIIGMLRIMLPTTSVLITSQSTHPRAMNSDKLLKLANKLGKIGLSIESIQQALSKAIETYDNNSVIIVTGSIFIAAAVREIWLDGTYKK